MEISVIVPTYNRSGSLSKTLGYLKVLEGADRLDWEIVIVDNNSKDDTRSVTESFASQSGLNVRYVLEKAQGASSARNRGIQESKGEILITIDDDVVIPSQWLLEMKKAFKDYQAACVAGRILLDKAIKLPSWWHEEMRAPLSLQDLGDEIIISTRDHRVKKELGTGGNVGFHRSALERNGAFRTNIGRVGNNHAGGADSDIILRLQRNGETVVYYPPAFLYHSPNIARFTKDTLPTYFYRYGIARYNVDLIASEGTKRAVAGVPFWRYKWIVGTSLKAIRRMLTLNRKKFFCQKMELYQVCGYIVSMMKTRRRKLLSVKPDPVNSRN